MNKPTRPKRLVAKNLNDMLQVNDRPLNDDGKACRELIEKAAKIEITEEARLSIDQASVMLGVSKQTLRNWEKSGKLVPERTDGGHRRYQESKVNDLRKQQLGAGEILLPDITPNKLAAIGQQLLASFGPEEKINLIISQGVLDGKVRITIDSEDGLTTVTKTFNMQE